MHPAEVENALKTMIIAVDNREQPTVQAARRYKAFGCPYRRETLNVGDYSAYCSLPDGCILSLIDSVSIERKYGLSELAMCYTHDRQRFEREFERAKAKGMKTYLLVEDATWENAYNGKYRSKMRPKAFVASLLAWLARYDCQLIFCKSETSGKLIYDILYRELKERLTAYE